MPPASSTGRLKKRKASPSRSSNKKQASAQFSALVHTIATSLHQQDNTIDKVDDEQEILLNNQVELSQLWHLPDSLVFSILCFTAAPTHRAGLVCQLERLCSASHCHFQTNSSSLWQAILQTDYGAVVETNNNNKQTRACKRLERSPRQRVKEAHGLVQNNTEIAFYYLSELVVHNGRLSKARLCRLWQDYGPHLRINTCTSSGGLFLVEVCRAKKVKESVVLTCVQELVERRGALVDLQTYESESSCQTALCVAAVRGMSRVVKYLLRKGASRTIVSSGRFRLNTNPKKTLACFQVTPLEFAKQMRDMERHHGATLRDLKDLQKCMDLLSNVDSK